MRWTTGKDSEQSMHGEHSVEPVLWSGGHELDTTIQRDEGEVKSKDDLSGLN